MPKGRKCNTKDFWDQVDIKDESSCWDWKGYTAKSGYGRVTWKSHSTNAHRIAWVLTYGEISQGLDVLHDPINCKNKRCCNPNHLRLGTHTENMRDPDRTEMTLEKARYIRKRYAEEEISKWQLAKDMKMSQVYVSLIVNNKLWREDD